MGETKFSSFRRLCQNGNGTRTSSQESTQQIHKSIQCDCEIEELSFRTHTCATRQRRSHTKCHESLAHADSFSTCFHNGGVSLHIDRSSFEVDSWFIIPYRNVIRHFGEDRLFPIGGGRVRGFERPYRPRCNK